MKYLKTSSTSLSHAFKIVLCVFYSVRNMLAE